MTVASTDIQLAARGRLLALAGLPTQWAWEGDSYTPTTGVAYLEEQFTGGPRFQDTLGEGGEMELRPMLVVLIHVPARKGLLARRYADILLAGFAPGDEIAVPGGGTLRVRAWPNAPYAGQQLPSTAGFVTLPVTIPFWLRTFNSI